jgi:NAD kinase
MTGTERDNCDLSQVVGAVRATTVLTLQESLPIVGILLGEAGFYKQFRYGSIDSLVQELRTSFYSPAQTIEISGSCSIAHLIC